MSEIVNQGIHSHTNASKYIEDNDPNVKKGLFNFQSNKLGFMTHFGVFNQLGIVESWALSDERSQNNWSQDKIQWTSILKFKEQYRNLNKSFNPVRLDTDYICRFIKSCGFEYFMIPTKHHDGFCLWDSKETEYNCSKSSPYGKDIYNQFIDSCVKYNLDIGAYFSKPDWANDDYWSNKIGNERYCNYNTQENSDKWNNFVKFTHNQINEITSNKNVDILWLDGGWVNKDNGEDLNIEEIANIARRNNPSTLVVDRTCGGKFENYITPEQEIPADYLDVPWESCLTLGHTFAYTYDDVYKSEFDLAEMFLKVICRGGNLLLNVALQPDGRIPVPAQKNLSLFANWYNPIKEHIQNSQPCKPYFQGKQGYLKNGGNKYVLRVNKSNQIVERYVIIEYDDAVSSIYLQGSKEYKVNFDEHYNRIKIYMPDELIGHMVPPAYLFRMEYND